MMKISFAVVLLLICLGATANDAGKNRESAVVLYSLSIGQGDILDLTVFNPSNYSVCTSYLNWPGLGDVLRVTGSDGNQWKYVGMEGAPVGSVRTLKIAPLSEKSTRVDLRKNYEPNGSVSIIGKVYFGALFVRC